MTQINITGILVGEKMLNDILVLDRNYTPDSWIDIEKAIGHEATNEVIDHLGESIIIYHGGKNRFSGAQSQIETSTIIVVDGAPNPRKYKEPALTNSSLFQRDRHVCAYCSRIYRSVDLTRDHIHPTSKGGKDIWMNVVASCKSCNSLKGDMTHGQKIPRDHAAYPGPQNDGRMNPIYLPFVPCKAEHLIMKSRNIKADQMELLLAQIYNKDTSRIYRDLSLQFAK